MIVADAVRGYVDRIALARARRAKLLAEKAAAAAQRNATALATFLRAKQAQEIVQKKRVAPLCNAVRGYLARKKLAARRAIKIAQQRRSQLGNVQDAERRRRLEIAAEERDDARALLNAQNNVKEVLRQANMQRRKSEDATRSLAKKLADLQTEEEAYRKRIADDYTFEMSHKQRALKKLHAAAKPKQSPEATTAAAAPQAADVHTPRLKPAAPSTPATTTAEAAQPRPRGASSAGDVPPQQFRGFPLDQVGKFLTQYEMELQNMKLWNTDWRRKLELEHETLRDARDRASGEMVNAPPPQVGMLWVPTKPLFAAAREGPSAYQHRNSRSSSVPRERSNSNERPPTR